MQILIIIHNKLQINYEKKKLLTFKKYLKY